MGGKQINKKDESKFSTPRILGAAFFGFVLGSIARGIVNYTVPMVLVRIKNVGLEDAQNIYRSSVFANILISVLTVFLTAAVAGFLARRKGALVGLLTNMVPILFLVAVMCYAVLSGANPLSVMASSAFFQLILIIVASVTGGVYGQYFYKEERDLDLGKDKITIFGVYIPHYLWVLPLILYPFISSAVVIIYAWIFTFSTDLFFVSNPSLWINISWWFYFFINAFIIFVISILMIFSFFKFWKVMQYKQSFYIGWERFWQIVLYGFGIPVIVRAMANFTIKATDNMYKPIVNDWKIGLVYLLFVPTIGILLNFILWITNKLTGGKKKTSE